MTGPRDFAHVGAALAGNLQSGMVFAEPDGHIAFWNDGATAIFGYTADEVAGQRVDLIVPEEYRDMHWAGFNRRMSTEWSGSDGWDDLEARHRSGTLIPVQFFLLPISGADGLMTGVIALFRKKPEPEAVSPA